MANNPCGQVNVPTVNNNELECDEFTNSTCVKVKQICTKVGNLEGENLDKFIERLCFKLSKMDNAIIALKDRIKLLEQQNIE